VATAEAIAIVSDTVALRRSHASAPPLDALDLVMQGRAGQALNFLEVCAPHGSLAAPSTDFGQAVAAAFDRGMIPADWVRLTSDAADPRVRTACLDIWRDEVFPKFERRYGVRVSGLP
jgi:hypothetical protein